MAEYQYKGMEIIVPDNDREHQGYFEAARERRLVVQRCSECGKLRWEPGTACPWCASLTWEWHQVSGKGTIYSYQIVTHPIQPGFSDWVPYPVVLVELDEQRGEPTEDEALRIVANLLDDQNEPEKEENIAIGKRVEVVFVNVSEDFTIPQFKLLDQTPGASFWQFKAI